MSAGTPRVLQQLFALMPPLEWEWRPLPVEDGPAFELVQQGGSPTNVFVLGATLSRQARWVEAMSPVFLLEIAEACEGQQQAIERLQQLSERLTRHLRRCYRLRHQEHYEDLRLMAQDVQAVLQDLEAPERTAQLLMKALDEVHVITKNPEK
ncbi:MAG: hypothetical protein V4844_12860 [Pseudomonadota bacterium]